ncbi:DUF29 family protein [Rhodopila globiformis]|nr:DUF29 family protein [Rhodopila globiformis]
MPDDPDSGQYKRDFITWAMSQAQALRAMRGVTLNREERSTDLLRAIDWDHLAAEIEGLAHRQRQDLAHGLGVVVEHLVRLEFSPAWEPRADWIATLRAERDRAAAILRQSPSLRPEVAAMMQTGNDEAVSVAADWLERQGATAEAMEARMRRFGTGYHPDQVLGAWIPIPSAG